MPATYAAAPRPAPGWLAAAGCPPVGQPAAPVPAPPPAPQPARSPTASRPAALPAAPPADPTRRQERTADRPAGPGPRTASPPQALQTPPQHPAQEQTAV